MMWYATEGESATHSCQRCPTLPSSASNTSQRVSSMWNSLSPSCLARIASTTGSNTATSLCSPPVTVPWAIGIP